jgi:tetratricopeptide (TPR) repeat protein
LILIKKDIVTEKYKKILLMVFAFLVFLFFVLGIFLYRGKGELIRYKKATFSATIEMIKDKPVLGSGIGTFKIVYPAYRKPEIIMIEGRSNTETDHAENEFLEVWSEEGIVGLLILLWFLFAIFSNTIKKLKSEIEIAEKVLLIGLLSGIITFWINSLYRGVSYCFVAPGFFVWLLTGITANIIVSPKYSETSKKWEGTRVLIFALGFVLIPFSILYFPRYFIADVHHNIAIFHSKRGEWEKALKYYNLVLENNPNYIMAHYFMGNVYNDRWAPGDPERVIEKYEDVKKLAPNYVQIHMQVATVHAKLGNWEKAIENYNKYLKIDPVFKKTYSGLGIAYMKLGKYKEAGETYLSALKWHPENADMFLGLGNIYYAQKKYNAAERFYKKVIEIEPTNKNALKNLEKLKKK